MAGLVRGNKGLVYPTNFAVSSDTATVQIGYPYQIPYTITPANATNQIIKWSSSNTSIATVDSKGVITAMSIGTCTVTGVYTYDNTTVTIAVTTTEVHTTGVSLDKHSLQLNEGGIDWLHATLTPSNTSYPGITWSSSDANVATVNNSGAVKYVGGGTCTITCTTVDGGYTDTCSVTCLVKVESVELNEHSININPNGTHQLTATVLPNNASDKSVIWSSSDTSIATVNSTGLVTYAGAGTCTITVTTTDGGYSDACEVVCGIPVTGVTLNETDITMSPGETFQLEAIIAPEDASNKNVEWSSSNTSVATVSSTGLVTCIADGECVITATTVDGGYTASCSLATGWTPSSNTILYYPFDGKDLTDYSGNNRDGSWYNGAGTYDNGIKGAGVKVAGTRGITSPVYLPSGDFTYSIWCNVDSISSQLQSFLGTVQWSSSYPSFHFHFSSSNNIAMGFSNGASDITSSEKLTIGKWTNIILVHSGNSWLIYKDKKLIASGDRSVSLAQSGLTWTFGCEYTDGRPIQGRIDEVILENKAWSVTDITKYYDITIKKYDYTTEYQPVEYIESTGSQVIKTGVYMNATGYRADLEYQNTSTSPSDQAVFGYYMDSEAYAYRTGYGTGNEAFTLSKGGTSLERQTATGGLTTRANSSYQFYIFAKQRYANGNYDSGAYCKLYSCKIYNPSNELIRDFIPCYRRSDGAIGLYDKVENMFYTNQGSGTFNKGPNVGITLNKSSVALLSVGETYQLTVTATPSSIGDQGYTWKSSDTTVATVNNTGLVTCVSVGECTITCTAVATGDKATCAIVDKNSIEKYYDLRGGSLAGLQAAGFNGIYTDGSYSFYSDGLGQTGGSNDRNTVVWINGLDFSGASKITLVSFGWWYSGSWSNGKWFEIRGNYNGSSDTNPCFSGCINLNTSSPGTYSFNGLTYVNSSGSASNPAGSRYAANGGDTTMTQVWDLVNKTWTLTFSGANTNTFSTTLTDAQVSEILSCKAAKFGWGRGYSSYNSERLKTIKILIEY